MSAPFRTYAAPGPVAAAFLRSRARVKAIMGPVGSGKTGAGLMNPLYVTYAQDPHPSDGWRRTRFACIRKTYRDLERTLIPSWLRWFPKKEFPDFVGGTGGQPARHTIRFTLPDGSKLEMEMLFAAIGDNLAEEFMRGFEVTGFYLNEVDHLDEEVLDHARSRAGRYPPVDTSVGFAGATWRGVWMDLNAPDTEHWFYRRFIEQPTPGWDFFRQPGGLDAGAENLANLVKGYYEDLTVGQQDWWIRRFIHNQFGYSRDGKPVFPEFRESLHLANSILRPVRNRIIRVCADAGRTPAAILQQTMPNGQNRRIAELLTDGMGATTFGRHLRRFLDSEFEGFTFEGVGDPAASYAARDDAEERDWLQIVSKETKIDFRPAPSNNLTVRLEAVRNELMELIDGQPAFLVSPACKGLVKGYLSGYAYRRMNVAGGARYQDVPDKNKYSHPMDADQYGVLANGGHIEVLGRNRAAASGRQQVAAITDDNPRGGWVDNGAGRQAYAETD